MFDRLTQWWDRIIQSMVWQSLFGSFQWLDWVCLVFLLFSIFYGIRKGLWKVFSDVVRVLLVIVLTLELDGRLQEYLKGFLDFFSPGMLALITFLLCAVAFWFLVSLIIRWFRKLFAAGASTPVHVIGGMLFGLIYGFLVLSFLCQGLLISPWGKNFKVFSDGGSVTGPMLAKTAPSIHERVMEPIRPLIEKI